MHSHPQNPARKRPPTRRQRIALRLNRSYPDIAKSKIMAALTICEGDACRSLRLLRAFRPQPRPPVVAMETVDGPPPPLGTIPRSSGRTARIAYSSGSSSENGEGKGDGERWKI